MKIAYLPLNMLSRNNRKYFSSDLSLWALIGSNLIMIAWALIEGWSLGVIMWIYWTQSVAIGILWFFKILTLKEFSTKDFKINDRPVAPTTGTKNQTAVFFLLHYGFFHLGYSIFLHTIFKSVNRPPIFLMAGIFLAYQCFSFFYNRKWQQKQKPNIGKMMFFPYARIIPMHITIIAGGFLQEKLGLTFLSNATLVLFMLLKTLADVIMHTVEHRGFADKPKNGK